MFPSLVQQDQSALQVIAEHLFRAGRYEVGCAFIEEAGLPRAQALTETFRELHGILLQVCALHPSKNQYSATQSIICEGLPRTCQELGGRYEHESASRIV